MPVSKRFFTFPSVVGGVALAIGLMTSGCGAKSPSGVSAVGTVNVLGEPLSGAVITLEPIAGTAGTNASTSIFDGKFRFGPEAELEGGEYQVRFTMIPLGIREALPSEQLEQLPPRDAVIGPEYDGDSHLRCDLKPGQENVLKFDITFLK